MQATTKSISLNVFQLLGRKVSIYYRLVKMRLTLLVVFTALLGYWIAGGSGGALELLMLALGGFLVTGSSNTLNQVFEKDYDKLMKRTSNRPLPTQEIKVAEAILAAGLMGVAGIALLGYFFNPLAGLLGAAALISYAFIYTPLKRISPISVLVGAFPGAIPPVIGWIAATGGFAFEAYMLLGIQFLWQFPHFWAIAWLGHEDYDKAGFKMLPFSGGKIKANTILNIFYTAILIPASLIPVFIGITHWFAGIIIALCGIGFFIQALMFYRNCTDKNAAKLMFGSFIYLPVVLITLLLG